MGGAAAGAGRGSKMQGGSSMSHVKAPKSPTYREVHEQSLYLQSNLKELKDNYY